VLMLAIALSGVLVGLGSSRRISLGGAAVDISSTRVLLFVAGGAGVITGISAFRQMDDKHGVPVLADLWGSVRGRPLSPAEPFVRHGIFVVFEGGEGAGKSTQVERLTATLRAEGRDVVVTREPGATDVGARIRSLVLDPAGAPSPRAEALLYAADRAHHVATVVRPAMARGAVVVSDRYVDSSLAYQGAGRTLPVNEISWLSSWATGGLKPDLVVLLDVEPSVGLGRATARGEGADRLEAESSAFHERVRYAFLDLAAADPKRYLVLDAGRSADEIAERVAARVRAILTSDDTHVAPPSPTDGPTAASPTDGSPAGSASGSSAHPAGASAASDATGGVPSGSDATQVVPSGLDATQVIPPVEPRIIVLGPDATQVVPSRHHGPPPRLDHAPSADETQVIHRLGDPAGAERTQVIAPPAAPAPGQEAQPVPPPPPITAQDAPAGRPAQGTPADQESPTDVAVEVTGSGTPAHPAGEAGHVAAGERAPDDAAEARRR
jgi:dTMP kinase